MAIFYVLGYSIILFINRDFLLQTFSLIASSAFSTKAAGGGFIGSTIMTAARFGIARGLFSNESGLGSAPKVAATAKTRNPVRQALVASTGTFCDTVAVCAMTGLVLVSTIIGHPEISAGRNKRLTRLCAEPAKGRSATEKFSYSIWPTVSASEPANTGMKLSDNN